MKDADGNDIKRAKAICTKTGFVFTSDDGKDWQIRFPDGTERYGGNTSHEKVAIFFLLLGIGHDLNYAKEVAFHETKLYGKYRKKS
jgi:hypothetical protein